jgi:hypothetical protein
VPLTKSSSKAAFRHNVSEMVRAGHPQKQALAASFRNQRQARAKGYADGGEVDRFDRVPLSSNVEDRRPGSEYDQRQQAADARQMATFRTALAVKGRFRPPGRASGGRVAVKGMLEDAAEKLEGGLGSIGKAFGGAAELPYRGGEITPWYVRSEAQQMRRAASGPIQSVVPGRTDALPMSVRRGSYVVPADVVSGMPGAQGNSAAGHKILENMFTKGPYGATLPRGGGRRSGFPRAAALPRAEGGLVGQAEPDEDDLVDIDAAGGEHILDPEVAQALGNGDPEMGFKILDNFVKKIRQMHIDTLKKLPGPKQ